MDDPVYGCHGWATYTAVSGDLETLHDSEIVYMTIKTVSNQVIEINGCDAFSDQFIGFLLDDLTARNLKRFIRGI